MLPNAVTSHRSPFCRSRIPGVFARRAPLTPSSDALYRLRAVLLTAALAAGALSAESAAAGAPEPEPLPVASLWQLSAGPSADAGEPEAQPPEADAAGGPQPAEAPGPKSAFTAEPARSESVTAAAPDASRGVSRTGNSLFTASATEPLRLTIPAGITTMISPAGERFVSVIFDESRISVHIQKDTGRIFVYAKEATVASLYVTTAAGDMVPLELTAAPGAGSRNIVIRRRGTGPRQVMAGEGSVPDPGMRKPAPRALLSADFIAGMKATLMALVTRNTAVLDFLPDTETSPEVKSLIASLTRSHTLTLKHVGVMGNDTFTGTHISLRHAGLHPLVLDPAGFTAGDILGTAVSSQYVRPGETVEVYILERY